jgi:hypothetical protein
MSTPLAQPVSNDAGQSNLVQGSAPASPASPAQSSPAAGQPLTLSTQSVAQPVTPSAQPIDPTSQANSYESFINQYGGQDRLKAAAEYYNLIAAPRDQFNAAQYLDWIHDNDPERYAMIVKDVYGTHGQEFRSQVLREALANDQNKAQILKDLGWNEQDYAEYRNYLQDKASKPPSDPRLTTLEQKLATYEQQEAERQAAIVQTERQQEWRDFSNRISEPVGKFIQQLNLPQTPQGRVAAMLLAAGAQAAFGEDQQAMKLWNDTQQGFMSGNKFAANNYGQLVAAIETNARPIFERISKWMAAEAEVEQLRAQLGGRQTPPAPSLAGGMPVPRQQQEPQSPPVMNGIPGMGAFSADSIKAQLAAIRAGQQPR